MSLVESRLQRVASVFLLCVAEGLSLGFVQTTYSSWLIGEHVGASQVALTMALFTVGLSLKPAWGLLVDRLPGRNGQPRRRWILLGQVGMAAAATACGLPSDPATAVDAVAWGCFLMGTFMALQDVALDGLMYDVIPDSERPSTNAAFVLGQVTGYVVAATVLANVIAARTPRLAFTLVGAGILALAAPAALFREGQDRPPPRERLGFRVPARAMLAPSCVVMLVSIALYATTSQLGRTSFEFLARTDLAWGAQEYSSSSGTVLAAGSLVGALTGAVFARRLGALRFLRLCALAYGIVQVAFGMSSSLRSGHVPMLIIWGVLAVVAGAAAVALYSALQRLSWNRMAASQLGIFTGANYLWTALGTWLAGRAVRENHLPHVDPITFIAAGVTIAVLAWPLGWIDIARTQKRYRALEEELGDGTRW